MPSPVGLVVKKMLEQLVPIFRWNTDTVITHTDLNAFAKLTGRDLQCGTLSSVALAAPLVSGIEAFADEVKEHADQFLRYDVNR